MSKTMKKKKTKFSRARQTMFSGCTRSQFNNFHSIYKEVVKLVNQSETALIELRDRGYTLQDLFEYGHLCDKLSCQIHSFSAQHDFMASPGFAYHLAIFEQAYMAVVVAYDAIRHASASPEYKPDLLKSFIIATSSGSLVALALDDVSIDLAIQGKNFGIDVKEELEPVSYH